MERKNFTDLTAFKEISPLILQALQIVSQIHSPYYQSLIESTKQTCVASITTLADGYNRFRPEEKRELYSLSRSHISTLLGQLWILHGLALIPNIKDLLEQLDDKLKTVSGLIRSMEQKE